MFKKKKKKRGGGGKKKKKIGGKNPGGFFKKKKRPGNFGLGGGPWGPLGPFPVGPFPFGPVGGQKNLFFLPKSGRSKKDREGRCLLVGIFWVSVMGICV